jgi:hypothetical protein
VSGRDLLDPRSLWLSRAARALHAQLDPGETITGITLVTTSADGEMLSTVAGPDGGGGFVIERYVVTDRERAYREGVSLMDEAAVLVTPENVPPATP